MQLELEKADVAQIGCYGKDHGDAGIAAQILIDSLYISQKFAKIFKGQLFPQ